MPVQFECPHCGEAINQTKKNRQQATIQCPKCSKLFSTQWARTEEEQTHLRGAVTSERFEEGRNFCNKLWNAARFVMINLEGFEPQPLTVSELPLEDQWILSRLATTTHHVTEALNEYRHADAAKALYEFSWDEFCSYYVEMAKPRLQNENQRAATQQVLIHTLDQLLRLLHPIVPFITEAIWQELATFGDQRVFGNDTEQGSKWLMQSAWPTADLSLQDETIEQQFSKFVSVLGAVREIRSRQGLPPKEEVTFTVQCDEETASLLKPMDAYFKSLAKAVCTNMGSEIVEPDVPAKLNVDGMEVTLDLGKFIDVEAEIKRNEKLAENISKQITGKQAKLSNEKFVSRAPAEVVEKEKASLNDLLGQLESIKRTLEKLKSQ